MGRGAGEGAMAVRPAATHACARIRQTRKHGQKDIQVQTPHSPTHTRTHTRHRTHDTRHRTHDTGRTTHATRHTTHNAQRTTHKTYNTHIHIAPPQRTWLGAMMCGFSRRTWKGICSSAAKLSSGLSVPLVSRKERRRSAASRLRGGAGRGGRQRAGGRAGTGGPAGGGVRGAGCG